jgi:agmatinase
MEIIRVCLINGLGKTKGCEKAPIRVLEALKELGSTENGKIIDFGKLNLEEIHVDLNNIAEANHLIFENSKEAFEKNFKTFFIGGDHSIDYSIGRAFFKTQPNPLLIVFDAHADCREGHKEPTNEQWLRRLVDEGISGSRIILISARNLLEEEIEFIKENHILWIKIEVLEELEEVCDVIMERARQASGFYVSIDIDCVDPSHAPGTGSLEPGGMSSRDLIYFLKRLKLLNNFKGADITEINPDKDVNGMTVKLGARLLAEMI